MQRAAWELGLPEKDPESIRNIIGLAMREAVLDLYPTITETQINALRDAYSRHYNQEGSPDSAFFPTAMETLETLKRDNCILAVATGKSRAGLDRILSNLGLNSFFHYSRCADETASKPHPLMLNELLQESGIDGDDAVMVGDTEWDMRMAHSAGIRKIAVDYGAHSAERLMEFKPEMIVSQFDEILAWRF